MANIPTVSAEERAEIRAQHTLARCPEGCDGFFPCLLLRLLDALEAAEQQVAFTKVLTTDAEAWRVCEGCPRPSDCDVQGCFYPSDAMISMPSLDEATRQSSVDRYNAEVTTNAAGGAPVYVEGPSYPGGLHPSIPRLGISCACADCTAKREATP